MYPSLAAYSRIEARFSKSGSCLNCGVEQDIGQ
jgi:hypothetical protein